MSYAFFFAEECFQNLHGDTNASCDSSGMRKLWDIWKSVPILSIDAGPHPANQITFDHSGRIPKQLFLPKMWFILKSFKSLTGFEAR